MIFAFAVLACTPLSCPQTSAPQFSGPTPSRQTLEIFGKINADWAVFDAEPGLETATGSFSNGAEMRRVRLGLKGQIQEWVYLKLSADLADAEIRDAFFDVQGLVNQGTLRLGHFREPIGLTNQTPMSYQTFMERPLSSSIFPSRNIGMAWQQKFGLESAAWTVGVFRETDDAGVSVDENGGNEMAFTTRITWLPYEASARDDLLHIGGSFSLRNPDAGQIQIDGNPGIALAPNLVDTGIVQAEQVMMFGIEAAWKHGPTSVLAEYQYVAIEQPGGANPALKGWYVEASQFLTGETRPYKKGRAVFWRVEPHADFNPESEGLGAFELGLRVSQLDLSDDGILGGEGMTLGIAFNWHLTSHLRFQTNLIRADRDAAGSTNILAFRFHLDF